MPCRTNPTKCISHAKFQQNLFCAKLALRISQRQPLNHRDRHKYFSNSPINIWLNWHKIANKRNTFYASVLPFCEFNCPELSTKPYTIKGTSFLQYAYFLGLFKEDIKNLLRIQNLFLITDS